jgi:hypothetical protein
MTPEHVALEDQQLLIGRAKLKAYRFPKGKSGNPGGLSRFYFQARQLAKQASPDMMQVLIDLAQGEDVDARVRSVCAIAVLDRGGVKPIDFDSAEEKTSQPAFNPRDYSAEELQVIEAALRIVRARQQEKKLQAVVAPT